MISVATSDVALKLLDSSGSIGGGLVCAVVLGAVIGAARSRGVGGAVELLLRATPVVIAVFAIQLIEIFVLRRGNVPVLAPIALGVPLAGWSAHIFARAYRSGVSRPFVRGAGASLLFIGPAAAGASTAVERAFAVPGFYGESLYGSITYPEYVGFLIAIAALLAIAGGAVLRVAGPVRDVPIVRSASRVPAFGGIAAAGVMIVLIVAVFAAAVPLLPHWDPNTIDNAHWRGTPVAPGIGGHLFGTDENGRDLWIRAAIGARTSLVIALCAAITASIVGYVAALFFPQRRIGWIAQSALGAWGFIMYPLVTLAIFELRVFSAAADGIVFGFALIPAAVIAMRAAESWRARTGVLLGLVAAALLLNVMLSQDHGGIRSPGIDLGTLTAAMYSNVVPGPWIAIVPCVLIIAALFALDATSDGWLRERS